MTPTNPPTFVERKTRTCRHFNGLIQNDACDAGVAYATVKDSPESGSPRWPCIHPDAATECPLRSCYTVDEAEEQEARHQEGFRRVTVARAAAVEHAAGQRGVAGKIPCPNCDGQLSYSIASNGHVWGSCSSEDCARWME